MNAIGFFLAIFSPAFWGASGGTVGAAGERVEDVRAAQSCVVEYHWGLGAAPGVKVELPREKQEKILTTLAQAKPEVSEGRAGGTRLLPNVRMPFAFYYGVYCKTPQKRVYRLWMADKLQAPGVEAEYGFIFLPEHEQELREAMSYECNKELVHQAIRIQSQEYMSEKASELEAIRSVTDCYVKFPASHRDANKQFSPSPEVRRELLLILSRLQLAPVDKVVQAAARGTQPSPCLILLCGAWEVELNLHDICPESVLEKSPWQTAPYVLEDDSYIRLLQLVRKPVTAPQLNDFAALGNFLKPLTPETGAGLHVVLTSHGSGIVQNDVLLLANEGEGGTLRQLWENAYLPQGLREDGELAYYAYSDNSLIFYNEKKEEKLRLPYSITNPASVDEIAALKARLGWVCISEPFWFNNSQHLGFKLLRESAEAGNKNALFLLFMLQHESAAE